ncbi:MAG: hypothetical protein OEW35_12350 [Gammaproteobacteria bacterium]|nr:hypothetical protein [Gammaproteobacteria bacterium]MDH5310059.1 hypothetical protein [Gammaproteobacteria bacterium]
MSPALRLLAPAAVLFGLALPTYGQSDAGSAETYRQLLSDAIAALDSAEWSHWAYTETEIDTDGVFVGRFDPSRPRRERWTLQSVNDRTPTRDEIEAYLDEKAGDNGWADEDDGESDAILDMIESEGLELVEETDTYLLFRFVPDEEELEEGFAEYMDATLRISKSGGPWLEYVDIHSNGMFSPQFGVRVRDFAMRMSFGPAVEERPIVPRSLEVKISIRAFLVINVDEHVVISYSDYARVGL